MYDFIKEINYKIYDRNKITFIINNSNQLILKGKRPVCIGIDFLLKVNLNLGVSTENDYCEEIEKIDKIVKLDYRPDSMMDCSIIRFKKPLWKVMLEKFDGAVGALPHYYCYDKEFGLDINELLFEIEDMAKSGISFITLHPTANLKLYNLAKRNRIIPMTSRGGFILLKDQLINNRNDNIIAENFITIIKILNKYNVVLSIGSVFRPATIYDSLDECQLEEIKLQKKYVEIARKYNVKVMIEGIGHISLDKIGKYASLIKEIDAPLMPLGPMLSDEIVGFDHINNALGALSIANMNVVGMINSVTREEHTGNIPCFSSIVEGLMTSQTVAHCYNISKFEGYKKIKEKIGKNRAKFKTCVKNGGLFNYKNTNINEIKKCSRCSHECPLQGIKEELLC